MPNKSVLKALRERHGWTQDDLAVRLEVSRSLVAQWESGRQKPSTRLLAKIAQLYGLRLYELPEKVEQIAEIPAIAMLLRLATEWKGREPEGLRTVELLCREITSLEKILGIGTFRIGPAAVSLPKPDSRWTAIQQGAEVARAERGRMGLGDAPVPDLDALLERQGVRVGRLPIEAALSGLTLLDPNLGSVIVINKHDHLNRQRFTLSHEYGHVVMDRDQQSRAIVSRVAAERELTEVRANAFAAEFLMPEGGVRRALEALGKGRSSRELRVVPTEGERKKKGQKVDLAERRNAPGSQEIQPYDVLRLREQFGVSVDALLYQLQALDYVADAEREPLLEKVRQARSSFFANEKQGEPETTTERPEKSDLRRYTLHLAFEAYRRDEITYGRLRELAGLCEFDQATFDREFEAFDLPLPHESRT